MVHACIKWSSRSLFLALLVLLQFTETPQCCKLQSPTTGVHWSKTSSVSTGQLVFFHLLVWDFISVKSAWQLVFLSTWCFYYKYQWWSSNQQCLLVSELEAASLAHVHGTKITKSCVARLASSACLCNHECGCQLVMQEKLCTEFDENRPFFFFHGSFIISLLLIWIHFIYRQEKKIFFRLY